MKITQMVYKTVVSFGPRQRPYCALTALAMFLAALVALAYVGGAGVISAIAKFA